MSFERTPVIKDEKSSMASTPPTGSEDPEYLEFKKFCKYMKMYNQKVQQLEVAKKKGKKVKKASSSSESDDGTSPDSTSDEEETKPLKSKKKGTAKDEEQDPILIKLQEMEKKLNAVQLKGNNKRNFTCDNFYGSFEDDKNVRRLPKRFVKFNGQGDPKAHLALFFMECYKFRDNHRALFQCFPRSLEGIASQWYSEHIKPIELKSFDKLINLFIERFIYNVEITPTITTLCSLRQKPSEKVRDFIQRWRLAYNKMKDPISEFHALGLITNNLTQPL